jgi:transcriptional regulator with XRE-family HTH domain
MDLRRRLSRSLRLIRRAKGIAQDDFSGVSGRTYLSEIERGLKNPTLEKLDELASAMQVHPITVVTLAYLNHLRAQDLDALQKRVNKEVADLLEKTDAILPEKAKHRSK